MTPSVNHEVEKPLFSEAQFVAGFHAIGDERYHHKHPFHLLMHDGELSRGQLQAWALNRYYYQSVIPIKDAIILSRSDDPDFRRAWRKRIADHDGDSDSGRKDREDDSVRYAIVAMNHGDRHQREAGLYQQGCPLHPIY